MNVFAAFCVLLQDGKDHILLARTTHVFQGHLLGEFEKFSYGFLLEFSQVHRFDEL